MFYENVNIPDGSDKFDTMDIIPLTAAFGMFQALR